MSKKDKLIKLASRVSELNDSYYKSSESQVSDREYDSLVAKLRKMEDILAENDSLPQGYESPLSKVGNDLSGDFKKHQHDYPMLSLDNTYNSEEVSKWFTSKSSQTTYNTSLYVEDKIDGLALSLIYIKGKLHKAVTRGSGLIGDDVTRNALQIKSIPKTIDTVLTSVEVRGEVYVSKANFNLINEDRSRKGLELFANTRNLASGTLKTKNDPALVKSRKLDFIGYRIPNQPLDGHRQELDVLKEWGFTTPHSSIFVTKPGEELNNVLINFEKSKNSKPYVVDGAVIKFNSGEIWEELGNNTNSPNWAIAYKFETEKVVTTLISVDYYVGRTGVITPVANLKPVELCGTIVKRATLHNEDYINDLKLRLGDKVVIEKGGEIIPQILKVEKSMKGAPVTYPKICPVCHSPLYKDQSKWYCRDVNGNCTQLIGKLDHFGSRDALNIKGLGEEVSKVLVDTFSMKNLVDLYRVTLDELAELPGWGTTKINKLKQEIAQSLNQPMEVWLFAMGIPKVGKVTALLICKHLKTWNNIRKSSVQEISQIDNIGEIIATNVKDWFSNDENWENLRYLKRLGMPKKYQEIDNAISNELNGQKICITGNFGQHSRDFLSKQVELLGGIYHNSIKKDTDILLTGENTGKNKIADATKRGVKVLSTTESLKLLKL